MILDGTCKYLGSRCAQLVDHNNQLAFLESLSACTEIILTGYNTSLGIYDELSLGNKLAAHLGCCLQIAAAVLRKVQYQVLHALHPQSVYGSNDLVVGVLCKIVEAYQAYVVRNHIGGIHAVDGNLAATYVKIQCLAYTLAPDTEMCN